MPTSNKTTKSKWSLLLAAVAMFSICDGYAQVTNVVPSAVTVENNTGELPYSTTIGTGAEHVDLASGNLIVDIPFISLPGRRMSFDFGIKFDARFWISETHTSSSAFWAPEHRNWITSSMVGWTPTQGYMTHVYSKRNCMTGRENPDGPAGGADTWVGGGHLGSYILTDAHGGRHPLTVNLDYSGECDLYAESNYTVGNLDGPSSSLDGYWSQTSGFHQLGFVLAPDGSNFIYSGSTPGQGPYSGGSSDTVAGNGTFFNDMVAATDVHGNTQINASSGVDSIGRVPVSMTTNGNLITYTITDSNGVPQNYVVQTEPITLNTNFNYYNGDVFVHEVVNGCATTVQNVTLPNLNKYGFQYDSYGYITHIDLPEGGTVDYQWTNFATTDVGATGFRAVTKRTLFDGVNAAVWDFSYQEDANGNRIATVLLPADPGNIRAQSVYTFNSSQQLTSAVFLPSAAPGALPLKQFNMTYDSSLQPDFTAGGLLTAINTTLNGNTVSRKEFDYDLVGIYHYDPSICGDGTMDDGGDAACQQLVASNDFPAPPLTPTTHGNVTAIREYDWGTNAPGPLVRQTIRKYLHDANPAYFSIPNPGIVVSTNDFFNGTNTIRNIVNKVTDSSIYDGAAVCTGTGSLTGSGLTVAPPPACTANKLAETQYTYDNGNPDSYGYFGDLTSMSKWSNAGGVNSWLTTNYIYDTFGNLTSVTDPKGNTTTIGYADTWAQGSSACLPPQAGSAYPTLVTNALIQQTKLTYYPCTGLKQAIQDPNDLANGGAGTTYAYDLMNRLTDVFAPDGGHSQTLYDDTSHTVESKLYLTGTSFVDKMAMLDGLGRTVKTELTSDPAGTDYTLTTYDGLGRVHTATNPYRSTSGSTYVTTYTYDALNRKTLELEPDGTSQLLWSYSGKTTTSNDEDGNSWVRSTDALGRLKNVIEPGGIPTAYSYDALGNLLNVTQTGVGDDTPRTRSFTYDSLSRLICAANQENSWNSCPASAIAPIPSGVVAYSYDANGNLHTKNSPAPNSQSGGSQMVTTTYGYDPLNRLISKTYSGEADPTHPTSSNCYLYDSNNNSGSNTIERLVAEWTQPGNCPSNSTSVSSTALSWKDSVSYDSMGRLTNEAQCAFAPCATPSPLQYIYDLAGNLTYANNGLANSQSPQVSWTNSYDGAGRLSKTTSNWSDITHPATLFEADPAVSSALGVPAAYSPFGGLAAALYGIDGTGNSAALSDTRSYDHRERLITKNVLGGTTISTMATVSMIPQTFDLTATPTLGVHVNCDSACGQVDVEIDKTDLGVQTLDAGGNLSLSTGNLPALAFSIGTHTLTAAYLGNGTYVSSLGSSTYTVTPVTTIVNVSMSSTLFWTNQTETASVHVSCNSACGTAVFKIDGSEWGTVALDSDGNFTSPPRLFPLGVHTLTVQYLGNSTYPPASNSLTFTVTGGSTATTISPTMSSTSFSTSDSETASVYVSCSSACGSVDFKIDGSEWGTVPLDSNGNFTSPSRLFPLGVHTLTVQYLGNSTYAPSSNSITFTVNP